MTLCLSKTWYRGDTVKYNEFVKQVYCCPSPPNGYKLFCFMLLLLLSRFSGIWLCDPTDGSPPGSPIPGTLPARTLEWVAISFSNAWKWKVKVKSLSRVRLFVTPWTAAHQAPPSMGFSRQEDWSGVPLPSPLLYEESINQCYWLYQSLHFPFQRELFSIIFQNLVTIH